MKTRLNQISIALKKLADEIDYQEKDYAPIKTTKAIKEPKETNEDDKKTKKSTKKKVEANAGTYKLNPSPPLISEKEEE